MGRVNQFMYLFMSFLLSMLPKAEGCISRSSCRDPYVVHPDTAYQRLTAALEDNVFGQHIAVDVILSAIRSHTTETAPRKALVLSFHGSTGCGKTYMTEQIMKSYYSHGMEKHFVKWYFGPHDFPDHRSEYVAEYKRRLREEVKESVGNCERTIFVFDEAHKIPQGVLDSLVPYLEPTGKNFEEINYRHSIFIFLSNVGAETINDITFEHWNSSQKRTELTFHDFQAGLQKDEYDADPENPGFLESRLLEKSLIDIFVPFLPMEKKHVMKCAEVEINRVGAAVSPNFISDKLSYWPDVEAIYSRTGCKQIDGLVKKYHTYVKRKSPGNVEL